MADKDIQIKLDLLINNADAASSVKEVRAAIKDLQSALINLDEGSDEFIKASKKAGELQDKVADVKDSIKSFNNSPIENVTNSFGLLGQKIKNLDFKGAKQQFSNLVTSTNTLAKSFLGIQEGAGYASIGIKGIGKAFAATGIGLFVIAVVALIANFDKLKDAGGLIGDTFKAIGQVVEVVTKAFTDFTDGIGLTAIASKKAADQIIADQERIRKSQKENNDFQADLLDAQGKDSSKRRKKNLEEELSQAEDAQRNQYFILEDIKRSGTEKEIKAEQEKYDKLFDVQQDAERKLDLFKATTATKEQKKREDDAKKAADDQKKNLDESLAKQKEALQKQIQELKDSNNLKIKQQVDGSLEELKATEEANNKIVEFYNKHKDKLISLGIVTETQRKLIIQEANDDSLKNNKKFYDDLDKQCQDGEDKITATKKAAAEKQIKDQSELDDISKKNFVDGENSKDDLGKASIIRAGDNLKKATEAEIQYNKDRIDRYTNYGEFELNALGVTEGQKQLIIAESLSKIKSLEDKARLTTDEDNKKALDEFASYAADIANGLSGVAASVFGGISNISNSLANSLGNFQARVKDFMDSGKNGMSEATAEILAGVEAGLGAANELVGTIGSALAEKSNERIAAVQTEKEQQIKALEEQNKRGLISDEQLAKGKDKINQDAYKKDLALRRKAFQQQKAIQIVQAVIGTAQGVVAALANPFPLNIAMAALAGITGAVNIGLIAAQKFPEGGSAPSTSTPSTPSASAEGLVNSAGPNQFTPPQFQSIGDNRFSKGGEGNLFVLVDDINRGQRKVSVIDDRSTVL